MRIARIESDPSPEEVRIRQLEWDLAGSQAARELDQLRALAGTIGLVRPTLLVTSLLPPDAEVLSEGQRALHSLHIQISQRMDEFIGFDRELSEMRHYALCGLLCYNRLVTLPPHCDDRGCVERAEKCREQLLAWGLARETAEGYLARMSEPPVNIPLKRVAS